MVNVVLVALAGKDVMLCGLGLRVCLLDCGIPAIALSIISCLEGVCMVVKLEGELICSWLLEIADIGLGQSSAKHYNLPLSGCVVPS